jgi:hypothetical protein
VLTVAERVRRWRARRFPSRKPRAPRVDPFPFPGLEIKSFAELTADLQPEPELRKDSAVDPADSAVEKPRFDPAAMIGDAVFFDHFRGNATR